MMHFCRVWHLELSRGGCNLLKRTLQKGLDMGIQRGYFLSLELPHLDASLTNVFSVHYLFQCKTNGVAHRVLFLQKILSEISVQRFYPP